MKDYNHLFFDLDHTLWDFDKNAEETLNELYHSYKLDDLGLKSCDAFIETYTINNHQLWADYHLGKINKEVLREMRFKKTFTDLGLDGDLVPLKFEDDYIQICPTKTNLFPHTHETLSYLHEKYQLHLISNGFTESTQYKIKNTGLTPYFKNVFISEIIGINKPDKAIFQHALDTADADINGSLMIGDSLEADVRGAMNFGMDAIYFNPHFAETPQDINWQINHLQELTTFL